MAPPARPHGPRRAAVRAAGVLTLSWVLARAASRAVRRVEGASMRPGLEPGDLVLVLPVRRSALHRGDVVVAAAPRDRSRTTVKRVVGLPGDPADFGGAGGAVPQGYVAVGGDNPARSTDSRSYGPVPHRLVSGRVVLRLWPHPTRQRQR